MLGTKRRPGRVFLNRHKHGHMPYTSEVHPGRVLLSEISTFSKVYNHFLISLSTKLYKAIKIK